MLAPSQPTRMTYEEFLAWALVPLFSDLGQDYFWHVDNDRMRNVQMRFYDDQTTLVGGGCERVGHTH